MTTRQQIAAEVKKEILTRILKLLDTETEVCKTLASVKSLHGATEESKAAEAQHVIMKDISARVRAMFTKGMKRVDAL